MKKKYLTTVLLIVLVAALSVGATLAYLIATTDSVTNTFTSGAVDISLTETPNTDSDADLDNEPDIWQAQMIPGKKYDKDPVVKVESSTNVDCYLFVKFEEIGEPDKYLDYTSTLTTDKGWTLVDTWSEEQENDEGEIIKKVSTVWGRTVLKSDSVKEWSLLEGENEGKGNEILVDAQVVTMDNMELAEEAELVYTAYAAQMETFETMQEAWALFDEN